MSGSHSSRQQHAGQGSSRHHRPHWLYLVVVVFGWIAVVVVFVITPLRQRQEAERARYWPQTRGVVVEANTTTDEEHGFTHERHQFLYAYEVEGRRQVGDRYALWGWNGARSVAVERHKVGDVVRVYYDPESPDRSLLNPNPLPASIAYPTVAIATAACVLGPWLMLRHWRRQQGHR